MNSELKTFLLSLASDFEMLGDMYHLQGDTYRAKTFYKAANIIKKLKIKRKEDLISTLSNIKGIGKGVLSRVEGYIASHTFTDEGFSGFASQRREKMSDLNSIYGIGPAKMRELSGSGITSALELQLAFENGKVDLTPTQEFGLKYISDLNERIPREEVRLIGERVRSVISSVNVNNTSLIVGSYRRELPTSGDIDVLMTNSEERNTLKEVIERLDSVAYVFSIGEINFHGVIKSPYSGKMRKLDIRYISPGEWESALLHYTGSKNFNIYLRKKAIERGLTLSEHGLVDITGERLELNENEIIEYLTGGKRYSPPERESGFDEDEKQDKSEISREMDITLSHLEKVDTLLRSGERVSPSDREEILSFKLILAKYSDILGE